jgi:hypothetical protein
VPPTLTLNIFENATQQYISGTLISLLEDNFYIFECSAYSNPGVSLSLYDTNTNAILSLPNNTISSQNCNSYEVGCTTNISVSLHIVKNQYDNLTTVTCVSTSLNENISLSANLSQLVMVSQKSKTKKFYSTFLLILSFSLTYF